MRCVPVQRSDRPHRPRRCTWAFSSDLGTCAVNKAARARHIPSMSIVGRRGHCGHVRQDEGSVCRCHSAFRRPGNLQLGASEWILQLEASAAPQKDGAPPVPRQPGGAPLVCDTRGLSMQVVLPRVTSRPQVTSLGKPSNPGSRVPAQ